MAQDIFIKLSGVEGESEDASHKGDIEVLNWKWVISQTSNMHSGSGGGAGKATIYDLHFEHYIDKSSPSLLQYCLSGKPVSQAIITQRKAGGSPLEYLRITLQEIIITGVHPVYYNTMRVPREVVALSFSRVTMDYLLQNAQGNVAGTVSAAYNIKANEII
ncbi:Hcp family type VI secretion system effector [Erwinia mallotivora]|uniref:Hcp family type VI secretion system effector n=1 Tax=Erwinia mallotivora TaxID=69222 RepID=UPI0035EB3F87